MGVVLMRRPRNFSLPIAFACASLALAQPRAERESPQRLVKLSVAAGNAQGEPVTDLQPADLQIREDGKVRPVVFFRFAGSKRPIEPPAAGEFVNRPAPTPTLILLDRWNERTGTAASAWFSIVAALQHMESVDRVYIYYLTSQGDLFPVHPLPAPGTDLRAAPDPSPADLRAKLDEAVHKLQGFRNIDAQDPVLRANTTFQALNALGSQMASIAGRKNLIWVTHGIPLLTSLVTTGEWADFTPQVRNLSAAAAESQIAIYTVDQSAAGAGADPSGSARLALQMFSGLTGGRWYPSDTAERAIADSIADGRANYRVAYYSPLREKDRKEHKIKVEAARKGIRVRTRESYFGQAMEPEPEALEEAAFMSGRSSPFDAAEIGLRVRVSRPAGKPLHFNIRVDPADVLLERRGEMYQGRLGVMLAFYSEGLPKGVSAPIHVDLGLTKEQLSNILKEGILIPTDAPVSDEIQRVRVMVFDQGIQGLGSVTFPVK
jgi:VWFA-related protein